MNTQPKNSKNSKMTRNGSDNESPKNGVVAMRELASRMAWARLLGTSYGGERDLYKALGYPKEIKFEQYLAQYKRQDIAKAVVNRPIQQTWKGAVVVHDPEDTSAKEGTLWKMWVQLERKFKLKSKFTQADKLAQLGRYSVIVLGFSDVKNTAEDMQKAVVGRVELKYVSVYSEKTATIKTFETDPTKEKYGYPLLYELEINNTRNTTGKTIATANILVHESRVIHVAGDVLEGDIYGEPYLEAIFNRLMDVEKLVGGSAEMYWRGARPGYSGAVDKDYDIDEGAKERLMQQVEEYEHDLRRFILAEGVSLTSLAQQIEDPKGHVDVQISMISAVTGIPKRILLGSEQGELASTQDRDNWADKIQTRREEFAEPQIVRQFTDKMMQYAILPDVQEYAVAWASLYTASEEEKAKVGDTRARALKEYVSNAQAEMIVSPEMFLRYFLELSDDTVTEILRNQISVDDEEIILEDNIEETQE